MTYPERLHVSVPGDGHCLFHALNVSYQSIGIGINVSSTELSNALFSEVLSNKECYSQFSTDIKTSCSAYERSSLTRNTTAPRVILLSLLCAMPCNNLSVPRIVLQLPVYRDLS